MHTKSATRRVLTNLEQPLYQWVLLAAERDHLSLSQKVRDLVKEALILEEDRALEALVMERKRNRAKSIPHGKFWRERGMK